MAANRYLSLYTLAGGSFFSLNLGFSMKIPKDCRHVFELMKDDYVNLKFHTGTLINGRPPVISYGDFIFMSRFYEEGDRIMTTRRYMATSRYYPEYNRSTGGYDYDVKLEAEYMIWRNHIFMLTVPVKDESGNTIYKRKEVTWELTDTLENHAKQILRNLQALGFQCMVKFNPALTPITARYKEYSIDIDENNVNTGARLVTYDNTDILSALDALCAKEAFDCEWWVSDGVIHFGKFGTGEKWDGRSPIEFKLNGNAAEMTRNESDTKFANRLYVLGGTHNLPANYRRELVFSMDEVSEINDAPLSEMGYEGFKCYRIKDLQRPFSPDMFRFIPNTSFDSGPAGGEERAGWKYYHYDIDSSGGTDLAEINIVSPDHVPYGVPLYWKGWYELLGDRELTIEANYVGSDKFENVFSSFDVTLEAVYSYKDSQNKWKEDVQTIFSGGVGKGGWPGRTRLDKDLSGTEYHLRYRIRISPKDGKKISTVRIKGKLATAYVSPWVDTGMTKAYGIVDPFNRGRSGSGVNVLVTTEEARRMMPIIAGHTEQFEQFVHLVLNCDIYNTEGTEYTSHGVSGEELYTTAYLMVPGASEYVPHKGDKFTFKDEVLDTTAIPVSWYLYGDTDSGKEAPAVVERRLQLPKATCPNGYVQAANITGNEIPVVEDTLIIDDVFPKEEWTAGKVDAEEKEDTTEYPDGSSVSVPYNEYTISKIKDANGNPVVFSEKFLTDEELKVEFQSGLLAGLSFAVEFNPDAKSETVRDDSGSAQTNEDAQRYRIIRNEEYGRMLPDSFLYPKAGDSIILTGWDPSAMERLGLVSMSESELLQRANKELEIRMADGSTYTVTANSDDYFGIPLYSYDDKHLFAKDAGIYVNISSTKLLPAPGDSVKLYHPAWFDNSGSDILRIIGYDIPLDIPYDHPIYTIGRTPVKSRLRSIEKKLSKV